MRDRHDDDSIRPDHVVDSIRKTVHDIPPNAVLLHSTEIRIVGEQGGYAIELFYECCGTAGTLLVIMGDYLRELPVGGRKVDDPYFSIARSFASVSSIGMPVTSP